MSEYDIENEAIPPIELNARPRVSRLNKNAWIAVAIGFVVVIAAAALTLSDPAQIAGPRETQIANADNADRHWLNEGDGMATPAVSAPPPSVDVADMTDNSRPNVVPIPTPGLTDETKMREERRRRAVTSSGPSPKFASAGAVLTSNSATGGNRPSRNDQGPNLDVLSDIAASLEDEDPTLLQNNQSGKKLFLDSAGVGEEDETNRYLVRQPISDFEVTAGMILPAVLITQGNSDLPGMMTGRVRENVYDSATGKHLLVPQGTTIVGVYDSVITFGQRRLLVAWQRLIFPDGTKLNIGGMPGVDLIGAGGFSDKVDRHYERVFGGALLLSVLTTGITLSQDANDGGSGGGSGNERSQADRVQDTLSTALGQNLGEVGNEMIRREMNIQPTIVIRPGYRFNVFVQKDLIFETGYSNTFVGGLVP